MVGAAVLDLPAVLRAAGDVRGGRSAGAARSAVTGPVRRERRVAQPTDRLGDGGCRGGGRGRGRAGGGGSGRGRTALFREPSGRAGAARGDPQMPLPVGKSGQPARQLLRPGPQPYGGLAQPQCRARRQRHRAVVDRGAVDRRAVGGGEVGDRHHPRLRHGHRAVQPGDVRIVQRHVRLGGAPDAHLPAAQQVDTARVRSGDDVQPGARTGGGQAVAPGRGRPVQGHHRAVHQRRHAQHLAPGVQPLRAGEHRHRLTGAGGGRGACGGGRRREGAGHRGEGGAGGGGHQHVATAGALLRVTAARSEDGQPDLHRHRPLQSRDAGCILAPTTVTAPTILRRMILIGRLCMQK